MKKVDDHERWSPRGPGDEVLLDAEYHVDEDIGRPAVLRLIPPWPGREQAHLYVEAETATGEVSFLIACSLSELALWCASTTAARFIATGGADDFTATLDDL
ncbi:hypothetical protein [Kocuria rhizophila]|uniref:hypothetical protein n=1 Tax=Kocuria rhizophila TaxID=72000 RepID=UPI0011A80B8B|nr:hypothetical protein [Kocuria rhizophila]